MHRHLIRFIVLLGLLAFTFPGSDTANAGTNYFGFRGGVNASTLEGDEPTDVSSVNRPVAGVVGVFGLTPWLAFQVETLWSGKGTEGAIPVDFFGQAVATGKLTLDYLEIPLLLRCTPLRGDRWRPFFYGGPGFAANLSASAEAEINGSPVSPNLLSSVERIITDGDLLLMAGVGIGVNLGRPVLEVDARYSSGLLSVDESGRSVDPRNRTWAFTLALLFGPGEK